MEDLLFLYPLLCLNGRHQVLLLPQVLLLQLSHQISCRILEEEELLWITMHKSKLICPLYHVQVKCLCNCFDVFGLFKGQVFSFRL